MAGPAIVFGANDLLTTSEVAGILKIDPRTLRTWRSRGSGPPYHHMAHNTIRYRYDSLMEWIERHKQRPAPPPPRPNGSAMR